MCGPSKTKIQSQLGMGDVMPNLDLLGAPNVLIGGSSSEDMYNRSLGIQQLSINRETKGRTDVSPINEDYKDTLNKLKINNQEVNMP